MDSISEKEAERTKQVTNEVAVQHRMQVKDRIGRESIQVGLMTNDL